MKKISKKTATLLIITALLIGAAGCKKNIFDKQDLNAVDGTIWNTATAANLFLNGTYDVVMPNWPTPGSIYNTSDELNNTTASILYGTLTGSGNEVTEIYTKSALGTDQYFSIYRCNLAIEGINAGTMAAADKATLKGQFFFLRAFIYFQMVKLYGGVPIVLTTQNPATDNIQVPRAKSSVCFAQIASDLDSAAAMLPASWNLSTDGGRITRAAAMAMKGKALLYWASPQFNPNNDATRWQAAYTANKAAYTQAQADGYALYPAFANIWLDETANNKERMIWRTLDAVSLNPAHGTNTEYITRPYSQSNGGGSNQPTWNLVQAFPMANGLPITDPNSGYNPELFWQNRDPRFAATIAYNGCIWNLSGSSNRLEWTYQSFLDDAKSPSATGFYCRKICNPSITIAAALYNTNTGGGSGMDWIEMRFAEVLLNYAECANAIGNLAECKGLVALLRARAGIAAGSNNYGLNAVTSQAQMTSFLLTEREIEFAMEGKRTDDLRRTRTFDKLTGTQRLAFRWNVNLPYVAGAVPTSGAVAGRTYIDVYDASGGRVCDTINVNNKAEYERFFSTTTQSIEPATTPVINYPTTYYFYPLPQNFIATSSVIQQTVGWPGGTFDPLQ
ncbi:RagB/SusD family nutrient uptake outer membrane protein [Mucilaginibacter sp. L196]|uniref:RagB/SusD family nutrient uptake outer membrane protein n=1 Tax=Mucilaginibacter sp. L196 TaxID=1641870 RepID=UPI00131D057C|nr:RagB/SusD family nutrient uptake outer membrane protein [Mucilaginibacter sp. L196]